MNGIWPTASEFWRFLPEIFLTLCATALMVLEAATNARQKRGLSLFAVVSLAVAAGLVLLVAPDQGPAFNGMLLANEFSSFFRLLVISAGTLVAITAIQFLEREGHETGEFFALLIFSVVGQCLMVSANELIMTFLGLEISSISSYVLAGYLRDDKRNNESALKYFLLGSFATAFFLYGIAWIYGLTGTTALPSIRTALAGRPDIDPVLVGVAMALMLIGLAFKISAAPFQGWAPDVYQGAPAPVSAFLTAGPKAAAFAILLRVFGGTFNTQAGRWQLLLAGCALATMVIGNFAALRQHNVKRLLAYSSIAHAGYVLVAVSAVNATGISAAMFYLAAYAFMNIGAFAIVTHVARRDEKYVGVEDFAGLASRQPLTAAALTVFLLSLIGVPLTGGFFGKFYIFQSALEAGLGWLTVAGLLTSAVAAYYYLRIIVAMYMREPGASVNTLESPAFGVRLTALASVIGTFALGLFPGILLWWVNQSGSALR